MDADELQNLLDLVRQNNPEVLGLPPNEFINDIATMAGSSLNTVMETMQAASPLNPSAESIAQIGAALPQNSDNMFNNFLTTLIGSSEFQSKLLETTPDMVPNDFAGTFDSFAKTLCSADMKGGENILGGMADALEAKADEPLFQLVGQLVKSNAFNSMAEQIRDDMIEKYSPQ